jgi:nucleoid DNA-binding protein
VKSKGKRLPLATNVSDFSASPFYCTEHSILPMSLPAGLPISTYRAARFKMTKSELIETVAAATRQPKKLVAETIELTFEQIARAIYEDQRFCMPGFGTFSIRLRQARNGFNPRKNRKMKIPAARTVGFRPAPELKKGL